MKRHGFTLVEALLVIAIIGVLTTMSLFVLADAQNSAKASRTKTLIRKINNSIMEKMEEYESKRLSARMQDMRYRWNPLGGGNISRIPNNDPVYEGFQRNGKNAARIRLYALRYMMRMDFPERMSDIIHMDYGVLETDIANNAVIDPTTLQSVAGYAQWNYQHATNAENLNPPYNSKTEIFAVPLQNPQNLAQWVYILMPHDVLADSFNDFYFENVKAAATRQSITWQQLLANQHSECLYMILAGMQSDEDSVLDYFSDDEIGDIDGDGLNEILDPWGTPIAFLRWAPGLSENWPSNFSTANGLSPRVSPVQSISPFASDAEFRPESIDPLRTDPRWEDPGVIPKPFQLVPYIVSAGPDRKFDIWFRNEFDGANYQTITNYSFRYQPDPEPKLMTITEYSQNDPYWGIEQYGLATDIPSIGIRMDADDMDGNNIADGIENGDGVGNGQLEYADNIDNHFSLEESIVK